MRTSTEKEIVDFIATPDSIKDYIKKLEDENRKLNSYKNEDNLIKLGEKILEEDRKNKIEVLEEDIKRLKEVNEILQTQIIGYRSQIKDLKSELEDFEDTTSDMQDRIDEYEKLIERIDTKIDDKIYEEELNDVDNVDDLWYDIADDIKVNYWQAEI